MDLVDDVLKFGELFDFLLELGQLLLFEFALLDQFFQNLNEFFELALGPDGQESLSFGVEQPVLETLLS